MSTTCYKLMLMGARCTKEATMLNCAICGEKRGKCYCGLLLFTKEVVCQIV